MCVCERERVCVDDGGGGGVEHSQCVYVTE